MRLPIHIEVSPSCEKDSSEGNLEYDIDGILGQLPAVIQGKNIQNCSGFTKRDMI